MQGVPLNEDYATSTSSNRTVLLRALLFLRLGTRMKYFSMLFKNMETSEAWTGCVFDWENIR